MFRTRRFQSPAIFGAAAGGGGGGYSGPGDVLGGAAHWWGLRAYSAAYATALGAAIDIVDSSGANSKTIHLTSTGILNASEISSWTGTGTMFVSRMYDQVASTNLEQAVVASMPTLILGPVTGLSSTRPTMVFGGAQSLASSLNPAVLSQLTYSAVAFNNGSTFGSVVGTDIANDAEMVFGSAANNVGLYAGSAVVSLAATDNTWHAMAGSFNNTSSLINVDGTTSGALSPGAGGTTAGAHIKVGADPFSHFLLGNLGEVGMWASALTGGNMSTLSSNAHTYWGF